MQPTTIKLEVASQLHGLVAQLDYWFCPENWKNDFYMQELLQRHMGWLSLSDLRTFRRVMHVPEIELLCACRLSTHVEIQAENTEEGHEGISSSLGSTLLRPVSLATQHREGSPAADGITIAQGGVLPNLHASLLPKRAEKKEGTKKKAAPEKKVAKKAAKKGTKSKKAGKKSQKAATGTLSLFPSQEAKESNQSVSVVFLPESEFKPLSIFSASAVPFQPNKSKLEANILLKIHAILVSWNGKKISVGRLGLILHGHLSNEESLFIKVENGGLKKFVLQHPDLFVVGGKHKFNPCISLTELPGADEVEPV